VCQDFFANEPYISAKEAYVYMYICIYVYNGNLFDLRECVSRFLCE